LLTTAFKNADGKTVVIVMNQSDIKTPYSLWVNGNAAQVIALPHSIATLIF
jgi:glucosylceramidase